MKTPIYKLYSDKNNVFIKREDFLPYSFGGNKYRIASCYIDDAKKLGANHIIAYGPQSSNLCRVIANMCYREGMKCTIISPKIDDDKEFYNSIILKNLGVDRVCCKKGDIAQTVENTILNSKSMGYIPYYIYGNKYGKGNEKVPIKAYYDVYYEILAQEHEMNMHFDKIFLACGTGMTYSGLLSANIENGYKHNIYAISVARDYNTEIKYITEYIKEYLGKNIDDGNINLIDKYRINYGEYNDEILHTIKNVFAKYAVPLDPIYTGKAFWGMQKELENIRGQNILFIHTGGTPLFFDFLKEIMEAK